MMFPEIFTLFGKNTDKICELVWERLKDQQDLSIKELARELYEFDFTDACGPYNDVWSSTDECEYINIVIHTQEKSNYSESIDANVAWHKLWCNNNPRKLQRKPLGNMTKEEEKEFRIQKKKVDSLFWKTAKKKARELLNKAKKLGGCVRTMEFEDHETDVEYLCEKGDVFRNLIHISINQH